ncbi:MAG: Na+/H+ antiporter subunit E [Vicinamibacteraceae bacterium]
MIGPLLMIAALVAVYLATLGSAQPADIALGAAVAGVLLWWLGAHVGIHRRMPAPHVRRVVAFVPLVGAVAAQSLRGTIAISRFVLRPERLPESGLVEVPIGDRSPLGVAVSALCISVSPGSVLVDVDEARGVMILHVVDARDPDGVRAQQARFYDRWQRHVFP